MQVPVFTLCYTAANVSNPAGRVATGFPLPSTGRGIEGEGWSYPEPPPVRFILYQPHPGSRLNTENCPQTPEITLFTTMNERLQTRVARATGPYRPATRRTERVRRSICQRRPLPAVRPSPLSRAGRTGHWPVSPRNGPWVRSRANERCFPAAKQIIFSAVVPIIFHDVRLAQKTR